MRLQAKTMAIMALALVGTGQLGAVKLKVLDGRPVVDCVYLNGHGPLRFLVDTGAQANMIDPKVARSAGLNATVEAKMISAAGSVTTAASDGIEVALGGVKAPGQRFLLSGMEPIQKFAPEIQGVLGQGFLSQFDYLLDLKGKRLELGPYDLVGTRVPLRVLHGVPAVSTSLGALLLDSGAGQLVLFGMDPGDRAHRMELVSGSTDAGVRVAAPLIIDGRRVQYGAAVTVPRKIQAVDAAGLLPAGLFRAVYVCNSGGYMILD
jgi:hypothetical protein